MAYIPSRGATTTGPDATPPQAICQNLGGGGGGQLGGGQLEGRGVGLGWVGLDSSGFGATDPGRDGSSGATIDEVIDTAWAREHASKFDLFSSCAAAPALLTRLTAGLRTRGG